MSDFIDSRPQAYKDWMKVTTDLQVTHAHLAQENRPRLESAVRDLIVAFSNPDASVPSAGEWTEWKGGNCPLPSNTRVAVLMSSGSPFEGQAADFQWHHSETLQIIGGNVVGYRVLPTPPLASGEG